MISKYIAMNKFTLMKARRYIIIILGDNMGRYAKYVSEKLLCEIYELFYWKKLDINSPNIALEIHSMMRFLFRYDLTLSSGGFSIDSTIQKFPYNDEIQELIDNLKTIKQDELKEAELNDRALMIIKITSEELHKKAQESGYEFSDFVISTAKIVHVNEQVIPQAQGKEIAALDYIDENEKTIDSVLELVRNIDTDIKKQRTENKDNL